MRDLATLVGACPRERFTACKCCGAQAVLAGSVDFNKTCIEVRGQGLPRLGLAVAYHFCLACGFLFSRLCDGWTQEEFAGHIYNADYVKVDPDYLGSRPLNFAQTILQTFASQGEHINFLDWGAGAGILARRLKEAGFRRAEAYDPFATHGSPPEGPFNFLGCFEVLEHVVDPLATIRTLARTLEPEGILLFSTLTLGINMATAGLGWWYVAPRNGHISIYSEDCLRNLMAGEGFQMAGLNGHLHLAWRTMPAFAAQALGIPTAASGTPQQ
ncbi:MAG: class I SAM-dependent methyltransferase [Holophaga sp.]|jgi:2-polyprenyl-6-hydroxyphenyl methylase/3-demethylubiquinone-9 3-methyltransferase